ncbi:uncharacterized protein LOC133927162 isoform X2 [Phragmites australis]|uniref:uncharacterized protein LOC133927162 isoform X2 n=1 Tax=Phragmites australis TaxID=29695 RepID=UPI002D779835|nr:uncharacterized protein LOC133927162 isoform X2 [Phragmites australis]
MAYVDHAFSITDEDDLVGGAAGGPRGAPVKDIAFAAALLAFGVLGVVAGAFMAAHRVGGDRAHELNGGARTRLEVLLSKMVQPDPSQD